MLCGRDLLVDVRLLLNSQKFWEKINEFRVAELWMNKLSSGYMKAKFQYFFPRIPVHPVKGVMP
jgi:hypothetical protein